MMWVTRTESPPKDTVNRCSVASHSGYVNRDALASRMIAVSIAVGPRHGRQPMTVSLQPWVTVEVLPRTLMADG